MSDKIFYTYTSLNGFKKIGVAINHLGLCSISLSLPSRESFVQFLKNKFLGLQLIEDLQLVTPIINQLYEYLHKQRQNFEMPINWHIINSPFQKLVLKETANIPYGHVMTYGQLAMRIGKPKAVRAVGGALGRNPFPIVVPCHRVVAANGSLGGFTGGLDLKKHLLSIENVSLPDYIKTRGKGS